MPSSWGKKEGTVRVHLGPCAPGLFHPPGRVRDRGGSIEKGSDSWETSLELATHPKANSSFSAARRCRRPPPHAADELNGHSSGTVGREAALRHGVTSAQRTLDPLRRAHCRSSAFPLARSTRVLDGRPGASQARGGAWVQTGDSRDADKAPESGAWTPAFSLAS